MYFIICDIPFVCEGPVGGVCAIQSNYLLFFSHSMVCVC
jgi:hypothetical protein